MFFLAILVASQTAIADQAVIVWAREPKSVQKIFSDPSYQVIDHERRMSQWESHGYISPKKREALFNSLHLGAALKNFDEVNRDLLVISARSIALPVLQRQYPALKEAELRQLIQAVKELK